MEPPPSNQDPVTAGVLEVLAGEVREISVIRLEGEPAQFLLRGVRTMPTPGWEITVDEVDEEVDARGRRVLIHLTEIPPQGIVPQVLSPAEVRVPLGALPRGRHLVAIFSRREGEDHELIQALILDARPGL